MEIIISMFGLAGLGRFPAELGPETRSNGSGLKNGRFVTIFLSGPTIKNHKFVTKRKSLLGPTW